MAFERDTIDVHFRFDEDKVMLVYKNGEIDITEFAVEKYPKS